MLVKGVAELPDELFANSSDARDLGREEPLVAGRDGLGRSIWMAFRPGRARKRRELPSSIELSRTRRTLAGRECYPSRYLPFGCSGSLPALPLDAGPGHESLRPRRTSSRDSAGGKKSGEAIPSQSLKDGGSTRPTRPR